MEGTSMTGFPEITDPQAAKFSPDGYHLAVRTPLGIEILAMRKRAVVAKIEREGLIDFEWSTNGEFLATIEKYCDAPSNLVLWDMENGSQEAAHGWSSSTRDAMGRLQWSLDG